jgi:hypothetical protein
MSLKLLENKGIVLSQRESNLADLATQQIIDKIKAFYVRYEKDRSEVSDFAEGYFLELLAYFPVSMCSYSMSEDLKLVIALIYFSSKPTEQELEKENDPWEGYSYEDLALVFDRSKATIHQSIKQKEAEAKAIIQAASQKEEVRKIAMQQLIEEEKEKIRLENKENKGVNEQ